MFVKYLHLERIGTSGVNGILSGTCHIFTKLDGTNGTVFFNKETESVSTGSRNRQLSIGSDNAGFHNHIIGNESYFDFLSKNQNIHLYGEWLVSHSIKTYLPDAWRNFYIFDVAVRNGDCMEYLSYDVYAPMLEGYGFNVLHPLSVINNPTIDDIIAISSADKTLMQEGGISEGVVIKNYTFKNSFGRYACAKLINEQFKDTKVHKKISDDIFCTEQQIVDQFCSDHFIKKAYYKIMLEANDEWSSKKHIPQLLGTVWFDLITEEMWTILKKFNNVTINFRALRNKVTEKIKETLPEIF